jgi:hypothetical protein
VSEEPDPDEFLRQLEADERVSERARLDWEAAERQRALDRATMVYFGLGLVLVGLGLAGWLFWGYLQAGVWPDMSPRALFNWSFSNEMVGLQNIVNWFLDQWIGWYPIALGFLFIFGSES